MNHYNNYYYDRRDHYPEVARLPYRYLVYIRNRTHKRINPAVYDPYSEKRFYKINCHAKFYCYYCGNEWTSNKVSIELWWNTNRTEFDVRMYGQKCKYCNSNFMRPYIINNDIYHILNIFIRVLTSYNYGTRNNINRNINKVNSSHKRDKCQKCIMFGINE
jgi:hypothetical protein